MDIYKYAAQNGLRFSSKRGELTVENLFALPLTSQTGFDLNSLAVGVSKQLKALGEESFVEDVSFNPQKERLTVMLDVIKDVIATKQAENKAARLKLERAAERKKILDTLVQKKDQALTALSAEELEKKLAELDA